MELYEGVDIGVNIEDVRVCPNCGHEDERYVNIINTPFRNGKRGKFYTWTCHSCEKELISYQEKRDYQDGKPLAQS